MHKGNWWILSNFTSLLFIVLIGLMWSYSSKRQEANVDQLTNQSDVEQYLANKFPNLTQKRTPTGLYIQSIKFNSSSEVNVTGYLWQLYEQEKYLNIPGDEIPVGFIFPEAIDSANSMEIKFAYRDPIGNGNEVIVWYFETVLKQSFNYTKYPFDYKTVWIRIWSPDFQRKSILVPMLESYKSTTPKDSFGFEPSIVLDNWTITDTFFNYRSFNYDTQFGIWDDNKEVTPELYFNLVIKRGFINSFVVFILPLIIIACLTFGTLLMITKDEKQASTYGMNTSGVIGVCSGLFFVILLSQVQIREQFAGSPVVYVEFFYPLMYVTLLGVSVNSFLFFHSNKENNLVLKWIHYEDNLVPKLLYWPLLLGSATIITAAILLPEQQRNTFQTSQEQSFLPDKKYADETILLPGYFDLASLKQPPKQAAQTLLPISSFIRR
ncbi:MAG: hypothetical protein F6K41_29405 [Symploca sp. SIO3E6]|nr:hypothetical protein [Caldora sp. SIO3E6]